MFKYFYVARSPTGKKLKGVIQAESEKELKIIMQNHNYKLLRYKIKKNKKPLLSVTSVNTKDLLIFCDNINMMLKAGLPLKDSIGLVAEVTNKLVFKKIIIEVKKELEKGKSFSMILNNYPHVFPIFFRTMIQLAEASGNLKDIFNNLIDYYTFEISLKKKILNSLFYPILLLIMSFAVIIVMATVIVPSFVNIFSQMNVELPLITRIIVSLSNFISKYYIIIIIFFLILILGFYLYSLSNNGKYFKDYLIVKLPIIKKFTNIKLTSRFCRSLKILIDSGIPIVISLSTSSKLIGNRYLKEKFNFAIDEVKRGCDLSRALYTLNFFPTLMIETLFISEKSANLSYSLNILSNLYDEELKNKLQKLTTIIEPTLILFIAGIVIILIVSVFIPLFSMLDNVGGL
jgi:type IV pilus assembly protein PilC